MISPKKTIKTVRSSSEVSILSPFGGKNEKFEEGGQKGMGNLRLGEMDILMRNPWHYAMKGRKPNMSYLASGAMEIIFSCELTWVGSSGPRKITLFLWVKLAQGDH